MDAEMPFTDVRGGVTLLPQCFGNCDFPGWQATLRVGKQDTPATTHSAADRVTTGQQRGSTGRADLPRRIEIGEAQPFGRHAIEVRSSNRRRAITPDVAVAE